MTSDAKSPGAVIGEAMRAVRRRVGWRQDEVATRARDFGLKWTQATVAAIETGKREVSVGELLVLTDVLGYEVSLPELFPPDELVALGPGASISGEAIRLRLAGSVGAHGTPTADGVSQLDVPWSRRLAQAQKQIGEALSDPAWSASQEALSAGIDALLPVEPVWDPRQPDDLRDLTLDEEEEQDRQVDRHGSERMQSMVAALTEAVEEVNRRAASRLGVDPRLLAMAARRTWGHSLTEERDRRTPAWVTSPGHITRELVAELRSVLENAGLIDKEA